MKRKGGGGGNRGSGRSLSISGVSTWAAASRVRASERVLRSVLPGDGGEAEAPLPCYCTAKGREDTTTIHKHQSASSPAYGSPGASSTT